ncbi:MAG: metallophosphoesterase [Candidatus Dormibacteraeota bacterium]|nr:metallophosphoesterase [Candidatus Dormibacteraeota bacterium]
MIRLAAVGDVHFAGDSEGRLRPHLDGAAGDLDLLLLAGDLTYRGLPDEAELLARELAGLPFPVVAVLGNHDYHQDRQAEIAGRLDRGGVRVLQGDSALLTIGGSRLLVAGVKGFGGGFAGACVTEFGEPEVKAFAAEARRSAQALQAALSGREADCRVALLHYAPVEGTLLGEHPGLWPFLGSYLLAEAADAGGASLVVHGHAHSGSPEAVTPGGVPVRNVAQSVIRSPYATLSLGGTTATIEEQVL